MLPWGSIHFPIIELWSDRVLAVLNPEWKVSNPDLPSKSFDCRLWSVEYYLELEIDAMVLSDVGDTDSKCAGKS